MSIIDTIGEGLSTVGKKLWLATIPILLDMFLWLGPKMSIAPVVERYITYTQSMLSSISAEGGAMSELLAQSATAFEASADMMLEAAQRVNFFVLFAWGMLGMPTVAGLAPITEDTRQVMYVSDYGEMFLWVILIVALRLWIACLFRGMLAQATRGEPLQLSALVHNSITHWIFLTAILLPTSILLYISVSFGICLGPLAFIVFGGVAWLLIGMSFLPQAIIMGQETPLRALMSTFQVVRAFFWPTVGLLSVSYLLRAGLGQIWLRLMGISPVLTLITILANAIIGSGLIMATFVFYRDRMAMLLEAQKEQRSA